MCGAQCLWRSLIGHMTQEYGSASVPQCCDDAAGVLEEHKMVHDADYLASLADKVTLVPSRGGALFQNIQSGGQAVPDPPQQALHTLDPQGKPRLLLMRRDHQYRPP